MPCIDDAPLTVRSWMMSQVRLMQAVDNVQSVLGALPDAEDCVERALGFFRNLACVQENRVRP
jgi:hypothetical protein